MNIEFEQSVALLRQVVEISPKLAEQKQQRAVVQECRLSVRRGGGNALHS